MSPNVKRQTSQRKPQKFGAPQKSFIKSALHSSTATYHISNSTSPNSRHSASVPENSSLTRLITLPLITRGKINSILYPKSGVNDLAMVRVVRSFIFVWKGSFIFTKMLPPISEAYVKLESFLAKSLNTCYIR